MVRISWSLSLRRGGWVLMTRFKIPEIHRSILCKLYTRNILLRLRSQRDAFVTPFFLNVRGGITESNNL